MTQSITLLLSVSCALCACAPERNVELANTRRFVVTPTRIAELTPGSDSSALPVAVSFGGSQGRSALYLQFPSDYAAYGTPLKAYLALSPRADASPDPAQIVVEAWRVNAAWQAAELRSWADKPPLAPPYRIEKLSGSPAREQRLDVTELVRFAAENPSRDFGIALLGRGGSGPGLSFATGISGGSAPRLEVYVP